MLKAGRPPNTPINKMAIQYWLNTALYCTNSRTAYALEQYFLYQSGKLRTHEAFICHKLFYHQVNGDYYPQQEYRDWFDEKFPGIDRCLISPAWALLESKGLTKSELKDLWNELPWLYQINIMLRKNRCLPLFNKLSTIDAFAACLWLIHQTREKWFLIQKPNQYKKVVLMAFRILCRLAASDSFKDIAVQAYTIFENNFAPAHATHYEEINREINHATFQTQICHNRMMLHIIDELSLLEKYKVAPPGCLSVADTYLTPQFVSVSIALISENKREQLKKDATIKKLAKQLRHWEQHEYYDPCAQPGAKSKKKYYGNYIDIFLDFENIQIVKLPKLNKERVREAIKRATLKRTKKGQKRSSTSSKTVNLKQRKRSPKISNGGQSLRIAQLDGLAPNDQDAGRN